MVDRLGLLETFRDEEEKGNPDHDGESLLGEKRHERIQGQETETPTNPSFSGLESTTCYTRTFFEKGRLVQGSRGQRPFLKPLVLESSRMGVQLKTGPFGFRSSLVSCLGLVSSDHSFRSEVPLSATGHKYRRTLNCLGLKRRITLLLSLDITVDCKGFGTLRATGFTRH